MKNINGYYYVPAEDITLSANADNLEINSNYVHAQPTVSIDITGFQAPTSEDHASLVRLENDAAFGSGINITLKHLSGSSSAGNQIYCLGSVDIVLTPKQYALFTKVGKGYIMTAII